MANATQPTAPFIVCLPNGPYYLILDPTPRPIPYLHNAQGEPCATSQNKPFCADSHWKAGFSDDSE